MDCMSSPTTSLVGPKLEEMNQAIEYIYRSVEEKDAKHGSKTLLVICGDHGMSDAGSHGGSSIPEIMTPLILFSPN